MFLFRKIVLLVSACLMMNAVVHAQQATADSAKEDMLSKLRKLGKQETANSIQKYEAGRISLRQESLLQEIKFTSQKAKLYLKKGVDTLEFRRFLNETNQVLQTVASAKGLVRDPSQTQRNLAVSEAVLEELKAKMEKRQRMLSEHTQTLVSFIQRIDSLSTDSALYTFPEDSAKTIQYLRRIQVVVKELGPVDTLLREKIIYLKQLQTETDLVSFYIATHLEDVGKFQDELQDKMFTKELPYLWETGQPSIAGKNIIRISLQKEKLALFAYVREHAGRLTVLILLVMMAWGFLLSLKQRLKEEGALGNDTTTNHVLRYPFLSSIIVVFSIFQFLFLAPPYIFGFCIWLVQAVSLIFILKGYITSYWLRFWLFTVLFFLAAGLNNMVLLTSNAERWFMAALSITGFVFGCRLLRSKRRAELKEKKILHFIGFMTVFMFAAAICNFYGRYNLSKSFMVVGFTGIVIAIVFLWTVRLINETLSLVSSVYKHPDRKLFYIDFEKIGESVPGIFYAFIVVGWIVLLSRNFYGLKKLITPLSDFLTTERTLGNYVFTIQSLFIFVLIITVSTLVSQIISFFAGEPSDQRNKDKKDRKPGVGSWLLLIRIFILSVGVFLAFAAAGIPMDKLAIVIGALGVGIGLGLQGLVSNLVSGLIIAFEKPVNVGDIIEVNGKLGTMKSIGFRSSVVNLVDGPCLIIPNSDLLSNQLINFTMAKNRRRLNVVVSVAYGSNLKQVKEILEKTITEHESVLSYPEPMISAKEFKESGVDFDLYFWIAHIKDTIPTRNTIISLVHETLKSEGIKIPFPQRDLHIITDPDPEAENKD